MIQNSLGLWENTQLHIRDSDLIDCIDDVKAELVAADQAPPPPPIEKKVKSFKISKAILTVPNLQERTVPVCTQQAKSAGDFQPCWAGEVSPDATRLELPEGTYYLKFHKHYLNGVEITAGQPTEIQLGELSMPSLSGASIPVCSPDSKCKGDYQADWVGEISAEAPSLEVPAGERKIRMGKQFIEGIMVAAGENLILE